MANERQKRLMQEALETAPPPEGQRELRQHLDRDAESTAEFSRLKQVDALLRTAPFERAPARLALGIMAKLAQAVVWKSRLWLVEKEMMMIRKIKD